MEGYVGEIRLFAATFAPRNWALCEGGLLLVSEAPDLFEAIGYTYGGNGGTLFALPDMRARAVVGAGQGSGLTRYAIGESAGTDEASIEPVQVSALGNTALTVNSVTRGSRNNVQPALALNYIICVDGILPSQRD